MQKVINWEQEADRAAGMTGAQLANARRDAFETAQVWSDPNTDPDGNAGFYMDQVSVYAAEQARRSNAR